MLIDDRNTTVDHVKEAIIEDENCSVNIGKLSQDSLGGGGK